MSFICDVTGKKRLKGHRVSHANNKSIHFQHPNLHDRRIFVSELGLFYKIRVSSAGLRTLDKHGGLSRFVTKTPNEKLSTNLQKLKKTLSKR
jgi:large subunit ribosomal protein L28